MIVLCPACGALVEAEELDTLVVRAQEHTTAAHAYRVPRDHVVERAEEG